MEYIIKGRNLELNEKIRNYAEKKIKSRIDRLLDKVVEIEVKLIFEKNPRINLNNRAEVTVFTGREVIRAADSGSDIFEAVDRVSNKLERQVKKFRDKIITRGRKNYPPVADEPAGIEFEGLGTKKNESLEEKIRKSIVKIKTFELKPISPEEAVIQMELLGHDFFVFINSESEKTAVVYRRKDKNYGLIEPA